MKKPESRFAFSMQIKNNVRVLDFSVQHINVSIQFYESKLNSWYLKNHNTFVRELCVLPSLYGRDELTGEYETEMKLKTV